MTREVDVLRHAVGMNVGFAQRIEFTREGYWQKLLVAVAKGREWHSFLRPLLAQPRAILDIPAGLRV